MTANRRIFLNIVVTYGWSLYALGIGLFCGWGWGGGLTAVKMVNTRQWDERGEADIAAVWPDDGNADTLRGGLLYHCYSISSARPSEGSIVGFVVSNFICWLLNRAVVFNPGKFSWHVELFMFYAASATAASLAIGLSWLCINCLGLMTTLAVLIEIVVSFAVNYFVRKFFIFKG